MLGAETVISGIIRLVTTVGILAAVYFLIVKPVLNTTEDVVHHASRQAGIQQQRIDRQNQQAQVSGERQRALSYAQSALAGTEPWYAASRMLRHCVRAAGRDLPKMRACANAGEHLTSVFSPRNIALAYATSVAAQGNSAGATSIRTCVSKAGFKPVPMLHCKDLATKLLFG